MTLVTSLKEPIDRGCFERLLSAFLAFDRSVVELHMHIYRTPPDQRLAMRRQNRTLHGVVRKRVPEFLFGTPRKRGDSGKKLKRPFSPNE